MIWLGLDPSLAAFGWAVFSRTPPTAYTGPGSEVLEAGVWRTSKSDDTPITADMALRVRQLGEQLDDLVMRVAPAAIFVEGLAFPPGKIRWSTISALGRIRGILDGIVICRGIELLELTPQKVKRILTGKPGGDEGGKDAVARRVLQLYPAARAMVPRGKLGENVTDAIAVGHCGFFSGVLPADDDETPTWPTGPVDTEPAADDYDPPRPSPWGAHGGVS